MSSAEKDSSLSEDEEVLLEIDKLVDKVVDTSLERYVKSVDREDECPRLQMHKPIRQQRGQLKIRLREMINAYTTSLQEMVATELGMRNVETDDDFAFLQEHVHEDVQNGQTAALHLPPGMETAGEPNENPHASTAHDTFSINPTSPMNTARGRVPPSAMARKLLAAEAAEANGDLITYNKPDLQAHLAARREAKEHYFFYGSLTDSTTLQRVLGLRERPQLKPAKLVGYHIEMWGPYPALLDGPSGHVVRGSTCEIEGSDNKDRLASYETDHYEERFCLIELENGSKADATTFMWAGDKKELKPGSFDLKDWQQQHVLDGL